MEKKQFLRVMTYNIRRCKGVDGEMRPERISKIISAFNPDIVALQEVDVNRKRTGFVNQPKVISENLGMDYFFYPRLQVGDEQYGIAVLSRHPMELAQAEDLPYFQSPHLESTAALWVSVRIGHQKIQIINTHFNHNIQDQNIQAEALVSSHWLKNSAFSSPHILCGDLNTLAISKAYRKINGVLSDAQSLLKKTKKRPIKKTWPSLFPMVRPDYLFVSHGLEVDDVHVPGLWFERMASDHLPLVVDLSLKGSGGFALVH